MTTAFRSVWYGSGTKPGTDRRVTFKAQNSHALLSPYYKLEFPSVFQSERSCFDAAAVSFWSMAKNKSVNRNKSVNTNWDAPPCIAGLISKRPATYFAEHSVFYFPIGARVTGHSHSTTKFFDEIGKTPDCLSLKTLGFFFFQGLPTCVCIVLGKGIIERA